MHDAATNMYGVVGWGRHRSNRIVTILQRIAMETDTNAGTEHPPMIWASHGRDRAQHTCVCQRSACDGISAKHVFRRRLWYV